jgi:two-component system, response regulator PdtaR
VSFLLPILESCLMTLQVNETPAVVLVVDDELLLRMFAVEMVEDAGFTSVEAANADQAVSILESRTDIALLFTDIQMPGSMDGLKLATPCTSAGRPSRSLSYPGCRSQPTASYPASVASMASRSKPRS